MYHLMYYYSVTVTQISSLLYLLKSLDNIKNICSKINECCAIMQCAPLSQGFVEGNKKDISLSSWSPLNMELFRQQCRISRKANEKKWIVNIIQAIRREEEKSSEVFIYFFQSYKVTILIVIEDIVKIQ